MVAKRHQRSGEKMSSFHQIPRRSSRSPRRTVMWWSPHWKEAGGLPQESPANLSTYAFSALTHPPEQVCVCLGVFTPRYVIACECGKRSGRAGRTLLLAGGQRGLELTRAAAAAQPT